MNIPKSNILKIAIVWSIVTLTSCQFTQSYRPEFNNKQADVLKTIKANYRFENIDFLVKKKSGTGGSSSSLTVKFINGRNLPSDDVKITELAKRLGTQIKGILKTPNEFDTYVILFDIVETKGMVTNDTFTGHEFKASEL